MASNKNNAHFLDSDITGTSGLDSWTSDTFAFPEADPAKIGISTVAELALIGNDPAYPLTGDYELLNDLDLDVAPYNTGAGWPGIGDISGSGDEFRGTFDGNFFTIDNMFIFTTGFGTSANERGLFTTIKSVVSRATVSNLKITNVDMTVQATSGALVGNAHIEPGSPFPTFTNCLVSGDIKSNDIASFTSCGGFVGVGDSIYVKCNSSVNLIIGTGVTGNNLGGFQGIAQVNATDCYATGSIIDVDGVGDRSGAGFHSNSSVNDDYTNCYATGLVDMSDDPTFKVGGFGQPSATNSISDCFWDTESTGQAQDYAGATGKTTAQMMAQATFTNWDFDTVWKITEGSTYPTHQWIDINPLAVKTGEQNRTTAMPEDYAHLEGESVQLLQDGVQTANQTVTGGAVTTTGAVNHVGLQIDTKIQPMKINGISEVKRIGTVIPDFYNTSGGQHGDSESNLYSNSLKDGDSLDPDEALFSGHVDLPFDGAYTRELDMWFVQTAPLPMHLRGVAVKLSQEDI